MLFVKVSVKLYSLKVFFQVNAHGVCSSFFCKWVIKIQVQSIVAERPRVLRGIRPKWKMLDFEPVFRSSFYGGSA